MIIKAQTFGIGSKTAYFLISTDGHHTGDDCQCDSCRIGKKRWLGVKVNAAFADYNLTTNAQTVWLDVTGNGRGATINNIQFANPTAQPVTQKSAVNPKVSNSEQKSAVNLQPKKNAKAEITKSAAFEPPAGMFPSPARHHKLSMPTSTQELVDAVVTMAQNSERLNVRLTGPQSTGKTSLAEECAYKLGWDFVKISCGDKVDRDTWFSAIAYEANGNGEAVLKIRPSLLTYAMNRPNTVILFDELNRTPTEVLNALYGILDESAYTFDQSLGKRVSRSPHVLVFATMNEESTNVGVFQQDSALMDRFPISIRLEPLPGKLATLVAAKCAGFGKAESEALRNAFAPIVDAINSLWKSDPQQLLKPNSIRSLKACFQLVKFGMGWQAAAMSTICEAFDRMDGAESNYAMVKELIGSMTTA